MEVMNRILSESDVKNKQMEFPARSLSAFPLPDGQNSVQFVAFDMNEQQWSLKVSIRNEGRYSKPWLRGEWGDYVHQKGLQKGDKVILTMDEEESGERIYRIRAERKMFGFWYSIDDQQ
ncbi:hypothetical protein POPTR_011G006050v4 [Populus trichocarpa]|jgi:hypothetical protein|uniref:Uncharacterized protein n=2 Tax=Populus trichocarpa TaxID=3694 RepID=A0ACC0S6J5_POPTR|nr:hypothetical protein POPTR_011G006050v4 [Populus trichocarpa]